MGASIPNAGESVVDAQSIQRRVSELAGAIDASYSDVDRPLVLLCVLKGALFFTADLARQLTTPVEIEFVTMRSYGEGTVSSGQPRLTAGITKSLRGRDVLIVEDIVDTGHTVVALREHLAELEPRSVRLVALLAKSSRRVHPVHIDWKGFDIPDRFVVGYGLDHGERHRNLADVRILPDA